MSELIDRGDILGVVSCFFKDNDIDGLADLEREINRLSTASPWRRVEEKPAKEEECLTVSVDGYIEVNWWSNSWGWLHDADNIEWWMPLPEPPKEGV